MDRLFGVLQKTSTGLAVVAGIALTFMMLLTVSDVLMRSFGRPIMGTYEVVGLLLAVVIGFSLPKVSLAGKHIYMDFFVERLSKRNRAILSTITRLMSITLFIFIGYGLFSVGNEFRTSGEVSPTIRLPFYPLTYGVGICCFIECFVFFFQIVKCWRKIRE